MTDLSGERRDYLAGSLADAGPEDLFETWLRDAFARRDAHGDLPEPTAMTLATVEVRAGGELRPRSRTVLLKSHDQTGFVFYTNDDSAKGRQLAATPAASLLFAWLPLQRQVRVDGRVEHLGAAESDAYWVTRPRASQLGALASQQSRPIGSREDLDRRYTELAEHFGTETPISRPGHWGGMRVIPDRIEFWQGRAGRMHDRLCYDRATRSTGPLGWTRTRLQP
jgi:pyridoxamine 5'-phosphate oxidase